MDVPYNEIHVKGDFEFRFEQTILERGTKTIGTQKALSRRHAVARVALWNKNRPDLYSYEIMD